MVNSIIFTGRGSSGFSSLHSSQIVVPQNFDKFACILDPSSPDIMHYWQATARQFTGAVSSGEALSQVIANIYWLFRAEVTQI